jgi:hypothetical protein
VDSVRRLAASGSRRSFEMGRCPKPRDLTPSSQNAWGSKLPRHSGGQIGAQVPSPDCLTLRLASNRIPTFRWGIYSAVTFVTEAIRPEF